MNNLFKIGHFDQLKPPDSANDLEKLASNETAAQIFLDHIWKTFGNFSNGVDDHDQLILFRKIYDELRKVVEFCEMKCLLKYENCTNLINKIEKSIAALSFATNRPKFPGQYIAYHIKQIFGELSYIRESPETASPFIEASMYSWLKF